MTFLLAAAVAGFSCGGVAERPSEEVIRWHFRSDNLFDWFGLVNAAVRCGDVVFLADHQSKIRPVNIVHGEQLRPLPVEGHPMALAADCAAQRLYPVVVGARGSPAPSVLALDSVSGRTLRHYELPRAWVTAAHFSAPASLHLAGVLHADPDSHWRTATPDSFYTGSRLGLTLSLRTGTVASLLEPYEARCLGGGCVRLSISPGPQWAAAQPTSTRIGLYEPDGRPVQTMDVTSPEFRRTGQGLPLVVSAAERLRWSAENSELFAVYQFPGHIATVHYRPRLPADWVLGQPVNFTVLMNVHTRAGTRVRTDVPLPDLSVCWRSLKTA